MRSSNANMNNNSDNNDNGPPFRGCLQGNFRGGPRGGLGRGGFGRFYGDDDATNHLTSSQQPATQPSSPGHLPMNTGKPLRGADGRPPVQWLLTDFADVQEANEAYYKFYEEMGLMFDPRLGPVGSEWQTETSARNDFENDSYIESPEIAVHKSAEDAEEWRKKSLLGAQQAIKNTVPGSREGWHFSKRIKAFSSPLIPATQGSRLDSERV
ncbi:hypothetical protein M406DRAFT_329302 [Cryphonectria parasitica EP155]|uniref:Uncharacterized protein n=1 Tax=Cryphonectria parasitica (strain ATCC 38755 / EP155) TaxID=660469 RepID=A0A9P5CPP3_CRYP1|nr:uncharacterized protein M406DRAFT_329302 [Cryphonectria parasitica EP155]KAF3765396.1 hypothetical protein M406DRAFT_329302 [Cryphonectria parasitica EP155]